MPLAVRELPVPLNTPVCVMLPAPPKVKPKPAPVMPAKLKESPLLVALIVVAPVSVIAPFRTLAVEPVVARAPAELTPVPIRESVLPLGSVTPLAIIHHRS